MKRIKTWKRWSFLAGGVGEKREPLCAYSRKGRVDRMGCYIVMTESDYRKVMAVYNAAMKWHNSDPVLDQTNCIIALTNACARAAK